ncbi:hypothetical protein C8Q77DRAFT_1088991 [Trametes polyzona]|nr:hypothetical protein C8Q77DRAFT_1088991 [Trametes polyzona]
MRRGVLDPRATWNLCRPRPSHWSLRHRRYGQTIRNWTQTQSHECGAQFPLVDV